MRKIIPIVSDSHAGFRFGLMNPGVVLFDEDKEGNPIPYHPQPTATQEYLWDLFCDGREKVNRLAGKDEMILLHCGDETHGNGHASELVSTRAADQVLIAIANFEEWIKHPKMKAVRFAMGTPVHNFNEGSSTLLITQSLNQVHKHHNVKAIHHGLFNIDGFTIDFAHHGAHPGTRAWLKGNILRFYLRDIMVNDLSLGKKPPDLVLRGHYHDFAIEQVRMGEYTSTIVILPPFVILSEYARKITASNSHLICGMIACEIVSGKLLDIHEYLDRIDLRTHEDL